MNELIAELQGALTVAHLVAAVRALLVLVVGFVIARMLGGLTRRLLSSRVEPEAARLGRRIVFYGLCGLFVAVALREVGFDLTILLGAAGILSVAIGFASQTSASNIISGLFLIAERPFSVGDAIRVGSTTGEVLSIDLLSVKLRTYSNLFVRIPNESLIKSEVTTLTRFPIRRADVMVGVAYDENLAEVRRVLMDVAQANPLSLEDPEPLLLIVGFGPSSVDLQFSVWASKESYVELKYSIQEDILQAFAAHDIEIPYPRMKVLTDSDAARLSAPLDPPDDD